MCQAPMENQPKTYTSSFFKECTKKEGVTRLIDNP